MSNEDVLNGTALARLQKLGGAKLVRQMIELYLENGPERIHALQAGALAADPERVERAAHTLKSSAGNLGAVHLQHTAESLETLAAEGSVDTELVERLIDQYAASEAALRKALEELDA